MFWPFGPIYGEGHKVRIYKEYHSVCTLSELGLSQPLSRQQVCPSPQNRGGGGWEAHSPWSPNSDDWRKSLALCLLCLLGEPGGQLTDVDLAPVCS